jgi:TFIIF-interacting CTD phosphatase-like protein
VKIRGYFSKTKLYEDLPACAKIDEIFLSLNVISWSYKYDGYPVDKSGYIIIDNSISSYKSHPEWEMLSDEKVS